MLGRRRRRRASIKTTLGQRHVFIGMRQTGQITSTWISGEWLVEIPTSTNHKPMIWVNKMATEGGVLYFHVNHATWWAVVTSQHILLSATWPRVFTKHRNKYQTKIMGDVCKQNFKVVSHLKKFTVYIMVITSELHGRSASQIILTDILCQSMSFIILLWHTSTSLSLMVTNFADQFQIWLANGQNSIAFRYAILIKIFPANINWHFKRTRINILVMVP